MEEALVKYLNIEKQNLAFHLFIHKDIDASSLTNGLRTVSAGWN